VAAPDTTDWKLVAIGGATLAALVGAFVWAIQSAGRAAPRKRRA
jgi:hypothetical protein